MKILGVIIINYKWTSPSYCFYNVVRVDNDLKWQVTYDLSSAKGSCFIIDTIDGSKFDLSEKKTFPVEDKHLEKILEFSFPTN